MVDGSVEPFTKLPELFKVYPALEKHKEAVVTALSRNKKPFKMFKTFTITRQKTNTESVSYN